MHNHDSVTGLQKKQLRKRLTRTAATLIFSTIVTHANAALVSNVTFQFNSASYFGLDNDANGSESVLPVDGDPLSALNASIRMVDRYIGLIESIFPTQIEQHAHRPLIIGESPGLQGKAL